MKKLLVIFVVSFVLVSCDILESDLDKIWKLEHSKRQYMHHEQGYNYFITCVENYKFIATKSHNFYVQLAGPIGTCKNGE